MEQQGSFWLPPQASSMAGEIDAVFMFVFVTSTIIFLGVVFFLVYYAWKYRRRSDADRTEHVEPSHALEVSWVVVPTVLVMIVFWWGMETFIAMNVPPANAYQVNVTGRTWGWDFEYPNGKRTTGELYVPVGQPVQLLITSQDVLHSFSVPAFRVKKDAVPNRYTSLWFEVTHTGEYQVFCTEYCGQDHSRMYAKVVAVERGEFAQWVGQLEGDLDMPLPELGEMLYRQQTCNACHSIDGSSGIGPSFLGNWGQPRPQTDGSSPIMDADYVIESVLTPMGSIVEGYLPAMPAFPNLTERQLQGLVAYIMDINDVWVDIEDDEMPIAEGDDATEAEEETVE